MSLGPVMLDVEGVALTPADRDLLREPAVGGVILFTRNYESAEQIADLVSEIRELRTPPLQSNVTSLLYPNENAKYAFFISGFGISAVECAHPAARASVSLQNQRSPRDGEIRVRG